MPGSLEDDPDLFIVYCDHYWWTVPADGGETVPHWCKEEIGHTGDHDDHNGFRISQ